MNPNPTTQPVLEVLRQAAGVHARHRAALFLLRSLLCLVALIPVLMVADVLFHFSGPIRLAGTLGLVLACLGLAATAFGMACFVRPPMLRIARLLESRNPALGSKLVNILQLADEADRESASPLTRQLARQAVTSAGSTLHLESLPALARERGLRRRALHTLAAPAVLLLLTLCGGHHVRQEWLRFLDPFGDHPPFSLTRLTILKPLEDEKVLYGASAIVEVRAEGHQPRELFLTANPVVDSAKPFALPMAPRGDGTFAVRLENIRQPMQLTAHTADRSTLSRRRLLDLILTPQIGPARVRLTPPAYTGQPSRELSFRFTALRALEGTEIEFELGSNRPLGTGSILLETGVGHPVTFPLSHAEEQNAVGRITATESGRLSFSLVDVEGNHAVETPTSALTITRDLPPALSITVPEKNALIVEGLTFPVTIDATDDYGLRSLRLHISINGEFLPLETVAFDQPDERRSRLEHPLDLAKIGASTGDEIILFAEAVDTRPEPQITRTDTRRLEVITEDEYNDLLREQTDVAMIAGKYEDLLSRFHDQVEAQREIEQKLAELFEAAEADPEAEELLKEFSQALSDQTDLNRRLEQLANEMADFGRDNPVYDFENELQEQLEEQAEKLRESAARNAEEMEQALESGPLPPETPNKEMIQGMADAAQAQRERLEGGHQQTESDVLEPLEELAQLHELIKSFTRFKELTAEQQQLSEQSKAYENKPELNAEDRLALRDMGARQRDLARQLEQLSRKLEADAEAAGETFPEAAASARNLADGIQSAGMSGLAREAARSMLDAKGSDAHPQAKHLHEEMDRLFDDAGEAGQQAAGQGLDRALRLTRGMNPGDSLRQMLLSRNFRMSPDDGQSGAGMGGFMASSAMDGNVQLLGGESFMNGPIANSIAGRGDQGGEGTAGGPTARIDRPDQAHLDSESARRTTTPGGSSLLLQYENIADAYFRRLTTQP